MDLELGRAVRLLGQVDRFEAALGMSGVAPDRAQEAKERYLAAREALNRYGRLVADAYGEMGFVPGRCRRLQPLANRTYRLARRYSGEKLYELLAESVCDRLIEGSKWVEILAVVDAGMRALGLVFNLPEAAMLRRMVESKGRAAGEVKVQSANSKSQNAGVERVKGAGAEGKLQNAEFKSQTEGTEGRKMNEVEVREQNAEVTEEVAQRSSGQVRTGRRAVKADPDLSVSAVVGIDVEWEKQRRQTAMKNLRFALAGHQRIVKEVVARRLCERKSFDELATMFEISREDVTDILDSMRKWVNRFTAYFADDWYWKDGGRKFILPQH